MLIISASGMLTGGRALHHLQAYGPDPYITHGEPMPPMRSGST
jgi:predicted metal-dependent RNase